ncbi:transmembrane protease serine 11B-like protein isoform X2 [Ornithodoros turicata]|uniref:transmembrane protease serine 11B-like protein isoform X2 n=1 Tax=Ornithodoros turicata TaxID=34597 RepID=UPI003139DE86
MEINQQHHWEDNRRRRCASWTVPLAQFAFPDYVCGGSLIAADVVLTAAHCVVDLNESGMKATKVFGGMVNPSSVTQVRHVAAIVYHEEYLDGEPYNDVALVKLRRPFNIKGSGGTIGTITLPSINTEVQDLVLVTGWGVVSPMNDEAQALQVVVLPVLDYYLCPDRRAFCAGEVELTTCSGDSGSAVVQYEDGQAVVVGIVAFGSEICGETPSTFMKVTFYLDWILRHTKNLRQGQFSKASTEAVWAVIDKAIWG